MATEAIVGGAGAGLGFLENEKNRKAQGKYQQAMLHEAMLARQQTQPIINRQLLLYDTIKKMVDGAKAKGQFDPGWMIDQLDQDYSQNLSETTGAMSAAMRNMGYRPGDSEVGVRLDSTVGKMQGDRDRQATQLRRDLFMDQLSAYNAIPGGALNSAAAMMGQNTDRMMGLQAGMANYYGSQIQNPGSFLTALMPFLARKEKDNSQSGLWNGSGNGLGDNTAGSANQTPTPTPEPILPVIFPGNGYYA